MLQTGRCKLRYVNLSEGVAAMKKCKEKQQMSCYFTEEELRVIGQIAQCMERPGSQVVQFGVRALGRLFKSDPDKAVKLTQPFATQEC